MRLYVISLDGAVARQQQAAAQLATSGVDFHFFPAVAGHTAIADPDCQIRHQEFLLATGRRVTPGEVGCFLSHRRLWSLCASLNEPIVIMEDDFLLSEDFNAALECLANEIEDCGFIRLQSERRARKRRVKSLGRYTLWRYTKAPHSAMCYGISPAAAERLLARSAVICAPVDVYMKQFWSHGQRMYGITPYTVTESELSKATQIPGRLKAQKSLRTRVDRLFARVLQNFARAYSNLSLASWRRAVVPSQSEQTRGRDRR